LPVAAFEQLADDHARRRRRRCRRSGAAAPRSALADDVDADLLVVVGDLRARRARASARSSATPPPGDDAFLDRGAGGVQRVVDAGLLLLHLDLGRGADLDDGHAAGQLRQALLQLLAVVVGGRSPRSARLICATRRLDVASFLPAPSTIVVLSLSIDDLLGAAEHRRASTFSSLMPSSSEITCAAGEDRDVLEHRLAAVAEARRLDGRDLEAAADAC
jgi:hypothetical protein